MGIDLNATFQSIIDSIPDMTAKAMDKAMEDARAKYKPLDDWRKAHKGEPKNLVEAVIWRETYKAAYESVYGEGTY